MTHSCSFLEKSILAYVDEELDASHVLHVEQHLAQCLDCQAHVEFLRSVKRTHRYETQKEAAPAALRARILRSIQAAQAGSPSDSLSSNTRDLSPALSQTVQDSNPVKKTSIPLRTWPQVVWALGVAAAAGMLVTLNLTRQHKSYAAPESSRDLAASVTQSLSLDDFAAPHARPLPPEEVDPTRIKKRFSPLVGVPVRPVRFEAAKRTRAFAFAGARLMPVRDETTATLFYDAGNTRLTVFVFDPTRIAVRSACCLEPKIVNVRGENRTVWLGKAKGYALAMGERDGVGFAVSADMREHELLNIVASIEPENE